MSIMVVKKDGSKEPLSFDKINRMLIYACENLSGVAPSEIAVNMRVKFVDGITTTDIQKIAIRTAVDLITDHTPNYQYVAARLMNIQLRKEVYGQYEPIDFFEQVKKVIGLGFYDDEILQHYTQEEFKNFGNYIDHDRDEEFTCSAMEQFITKYLVKDKSTKPYKMVETPQVAYMLIAMTLFSRKPKHIRTILVRDYYDAISKAKKSTISIPTPLIAGVRTKVRQYSSCVVIKVGDDLDSIKAASSSIVDYVSQRAGIGIDISEMRPQGSPIRGGDATHTGMIPFIKLFEASTKSCSQGGVRSGAATMYFPIWSKEIEDLLVLKNNKGTQDNRVRGLDYGIQINQHFYEKAINKEDYMLFSPHDYPDLYDAFFRDQAKFVALYDKYHKAKNVKRVNAWDLLISLVGERVQTGRIYIFNVDRVSNQKTYIDSTVYSSNLCLEIAGSTANLTKLSSFKTSEYAKLSNLNEDQVRDLYKMPIKEFHDKFGEINLCTLSAINWGNIKKPSDLEKPCKLAVYALDELLDYQNYPLIAAEIPAKNRRNLGIGIINLAHFLAKRGLKYGEGLEIVDEYMEAMYFYLLTASVELAKEKGACEWYKDTIYSRGEFIWEKRVPFIDTIVPHNPKQDWESLRAEMLKWGVRHSLLVALMPAETSASISNATNGIEPPRSVITVKTSKDSVMKQVVPDPRAKYHFLWDHQNPIGYLNVLGVLQKYTDQAISANTSYNPELFPNNKIPASRIIHDIMYANKVGLKTLYYNNTMVKTDQSIDDAVQGLPQGDQVEAECESCKI